MRTLIAGVGYSNLSDLSVGPLAAAKLRRETWPEHVEVDDLSYGPIAVVHRFAEVSPPYGRLVLVGAAARGGRPHRCAVTAGEGCCRLPRRSRRAWPRLSLA
jgi:Ni,Fe-hydrogenase maturation factor